MGPRPEDTATLRALKKRPVLQRDEGRDEGNCFLRRERCQDSIAVRTTIVPRVVQVEINLVFRMELAQLSFDCVAYDQGMAATKELA